MNGQQFSFGDKLNVKKILDAGPDGAFIALQVLDASTLFFSGSKDILTTQGGGNALPNINQGFQLKAAQGILLMWWDGPLYGITDTTQAIIVAGILHKVKRGSRSAQGAEYPEGDAAHGTPGFDEGGSV